MADGSSSVLWWTAAVNAAAVLVAPAIALWVQRHVDKRKAERDRKQTIFNALWVNRRRPYYLSRIDALNMIDIEFYDNKTVRDAWMELFAHYNQPHPGNTDDQILQQREDLFTALLYELSKPLGYSFGKAEIKANYYRPELHQTLDNIEFETKARILDLLKSDALPVRFVSNESPEEPS